MKKLFALCCLTAMAIPLTAGFAASTATGNDILLGDVNADGVVNIDDATLIQKYAAEIATPYDIGKPISLDPQPTTEPVTQPSGDDLPDVSAFGDENNIELTVWVPDQAVSLTKQQVEEFKKAYPEKTFKSIRVVAQDEGNAGVTILNDASAAADVFSGASDQLSLMVENECLAPVAFPDAVSAMNDAVADKAATVDDTLFAYPESNDNTYCLVYDSAVVSAAQAGRLEDILAACKNADRKFVFNCDNGFYSCAFAFTGGVKPDGKYTETLILEEPEDPDDDGGYQVEYQYIDVQKFAEYDEETAAKTLQAFSKLMHDYKGTFVSMDVAQIATGFAQETVGAGVDGTWNISADKAVLDDRFGAAKLPTVTVDGSERQIVPMCGYRFLCVNAASRFPKSAQVLAYFLSGESCQRARAGSLGWSPTNKQVQSEPVVTADPVLTAVKEQSAFAVPQVDVVGSFWWPMGHLGDMLIADETDPEDADFFTDLLQETIMLIVNA